MVSDDAAGKFLRRRLDSSPDVMSEAETENGWHMRQQARTYGAIGANGSHEILPPVIVTKLASGTATHSSARLSNGSETIARAPLENRPASGAISIVALRLAL